MNPCTDLEGKVALVTGSDRGIGATLAQCLEDQGATVYRHAKNWSQPTSSLAADLSSLEGIVGLAEDLATRISKLDILVNNAGVEIAAPVDRLRHEDLNTTFAVNVQAPLLLVRHLLPMLRLAEAASIINVSSIHDTVPYLGNVGYVASKAALEAGTRTLALELASQGIRVNTLAPGAIETDMNREVITALGANGFPAWIPMGRVGTPEDLAGAVLFLASDVSRYVTGARIVVDGGYSLNLLRYRLNDLPQS